jgi:5-methylcytosine-specific restriction protein B
LAAQLLDDGYAGIIYAGLPGTGKSRTARRVALWLAGSDPSRYRMIQFHPSYQYEDFMQGFVPQENGEGFRLQSKHFVEMCHLAQQAYPKLHVLVIDELSRVDPSRVFGEALGFIEQDKKGRVFKLASGQELVVPDNLIILATMNDRDRGVDEVDVAFERRFARVEVAPSSEALESILTENGVEVELRKRLGDFFRYLLRHANPEVHLGHGYFARVRDLASLERLWNYQLLHLIQRAFRAVPSEAELTAIKQQWQRVLTAPATGSTSATNSAETDGTPQS